MERKQITRTVLVALFAALVAAGAFIKIPFVPVPMTLQTLFALLAAACLPPSMAVSSISCSWTYRRLSFWHDTWSACRLCFDEGS